jgi:hypothetical protein
MTAKFSRQSWHEIQPIIVLFHPDYTVGLGISPSLLTPKLMGRSRAFSLSTNLPPVGNYTPP